MQQKVLILFIVLTEARKTFFVLQKNVGDIFSSRPQNTINNLPLLFVYYQIERIRFLSIF